MGKVDCFFTVEVKEEYTGDPLGCLLVLPCSVIKINRKLQQSIITQAEYITTQTLQK